MAEKERRFENYPMLEQGSKRFMTEPQSGYSLTSEQLDSLNDSEIESLGMMLMRMFNEPSPSSVNVQKPQTVTGQPPKQAPQAQKVLNTIDRGLERIGDPSDVMPGMGTYNQMKSQPLTMPVPGQPLRNFESRPMPSRQLDPPVRMPSRASRQIRSMLNQRYNQQQPNIYNPLGGQPMQQQAPMYMFDPSGVR